MKSRPPLCFAILTLCARLALAVPSAAQDDQDYNKHKHYHYQLIDMGTFGGSESSINFAVDANERAVNQRGVTVGFSATSVPKSPHSHPHICGGDDGFGTSTTHAFQWQGNKVKDLGALPPKKTNCSNAYQVNANREIAGFSENGEFDPQTGVNQSLFRRCRRFFVNCIL
jgi:hypothetical protein